MRICLNAIVKDEAHIILEMLESVASYVCYWIISDTGSTDGTQDVIREFFKKRGIPGELHEDQWKNFSHNRTNAIAHCHNSPKKHSFDYVLVMDADDLLEGKLIIPDKASHPDAYKLRITGGGIVYDRLQLFNNNLRWGYKGVVHEYAVCLDNGSFSNEFLEGNYSIVSRRLGARSKDPEKYLRDAEMLIQGIEEEPEMETRYTFYAAQSYRDYGDNEKALQYYQKRTTLGGWKDEVYCSYFYIAQIYQKLNKRSADVISAFLDAHRCDPSRAEPLFEVALIYNRIGDNPSAYDYAKKATEIPFPGPEHLFVTNDVYEWKALDLLSFVSYYIGKYEESVEYYRELLDERNIPEEQRERVEKNRVFSLEKVMENYLAYPSGVIRDILKRQKQEDAYGVVFTITTCKRFDLFTKTMNSFLTCCQDVHLVDRWICVDDNSSEEDRKKMRELYPFFYFYLKGPEDKGHSRSMNIIAEAVKNYSAGAPMYWLHMEDDWHFVEKRRYITPAINILELHSKDDTGNIGQVLFNKNYTETLDNIIPGGFPRVLEVDTPSSTAASRSSTAASRYLVHEHYATGSQKMKELNARLKRGNNAYWPHYSLRPSLCKTEILEKVGPYRDDVTHFEMDFANRYKSLGYVSAFFDTVCCVHTGRLTTEINTDKPNAYSLNNENQFGKNPKTQTNLASYTGVVIPPNHASCIPIHEEPQILELEGYTFYPGQDIWGNDIQYRSGDSILELMELSDRDPLCLSFNTYGYLKNVNTDNFPLISLEQRKNQKYVDGLYVKNERVYVSLHHGWVPSAYLKSMWNNMSQNGRGRWNNIQLVDDTFENPDYYALINLPHKSMETKITPENTLLFHMEPMRLDQQGGWGVKGWGKWKEPNPSKFVYLGTHERDHNNVEWHLGHTYSQLLTTSPKKHKTLSTILTSKKIDRGHRKRIDFIRKVEARGIAIDVYGKCRKLGFKNYQRELPSYQKEDGIFDYKYTIACENTCERNYFTEKIIDCILGEALCFYWGCPNLEEFFPGAFVRLDLEDMESDIDLMLACIRRGEWEKRLPYIRRAKLKILTELQFFPRIERIITDDMNNLLPRCFYISKGSIPWEVRRLGDIDKVRDTGNRTLNHRSAWEKTACGSSIVLVLEHGVIPGKKFVQVVNRVCRRFAREELDFAWLRQQGDFSAYILTCLGASKLLGMHEEAVDHSTLPQLSDSVSEQVLRADALKTIVVQPSPLLSPVFYVCSYGGCGSKMLCSYLSRFGTVHHVHSRNPPQRLTGVGVNVYDEWFNNIEVPEGEILRYKVIYIYRNPVKSILSRFELPGHLEHIQCPNKVTLEDVLREGKDLYGIEEFFENYTSKAGRNYNVYCVKYEDLFENMREFNEVLGLPNDEALYPVRRETEKQGVEDVVVRLTEIYSDLIEKMGRRKFLEVV